MKYEQSTLPCPETAVVLAYIYRELDERGTDLFEDHLRGCDPCISELADLSLSHYSVSEWKVMEFDPVPTPRITLPAITENEGATWLGAIRDLILANTRLAALAGSFAVLVLGVAAVLMIGASDVPVLPVEVADNISLPAPSATTNAAATAPEEVAKLPERARPSTAGATPDQAVTRSAQKRIPVKNTKSPASSQPTSPVRPRESTFATITLSGYEDDEDESLRLSDLFDDIGVSD